MEKYQLSFKKHLKLQDWVTAMVKDQKMTTTKMQSPTRDETFLVHNFTSLP
jgi:hypothetical protein